MWIGSKQFILSDFITDFLTLSGKTNGIQTNAGYDNTVHALTTNFACIYVFFFNTFCLSKKKKKNRRELDKRSSQTSHLISVIVDSGEQARWHF